MQLFAATRYPRFNQLKIIEEKYNNNTTKQTKKKKEKRGKKWIEKE